ncbi:hypothetical protein HYV50_00395 [Candidatus Pacearchaeota archaeon]|nr:hypothetical protein [Candidatus Pacearchaeota archaeon]
MRHAKKLNLRELFLKNFVKSLILNSAPATPETIRGEVLQESPFVITSETIKQQTEKQKIQVQKQPFQISLQKQFLQPIQPPKFAQAKPPVRLSPQMQYLPSASPGRKQPSISATQTQAPPPWLKPLYPTNIPIEKADLGKITSLLSDPAVIGIECPGPGKNIIVNKSGSIQATPINLTKEEIDSIMNEISEKTRIPLLIGLFKAALGDILITAVVSEYVGTRFMIQKITPFTQM